MKYGTKLIKWRILFHTKFHKNSLMPSHGDKMCSIVQLLLCRHSAVLARFVKFYQFFVDTTVTLGNATWLSFRYFELIVSVL